ncbi:IS481 family transposase [Corynebacterium pseudodiphtheriticum]|uniref:IS481 family transposase n=1 Tax=Corynebacterium pseudodiphtheriticum TaxID=37637 RepID=UPI00234D1858|nr:IS481 family transposase [Corynebacterium pseudodiphtheriticum]MDC7113717.1 IS481 family transposase [Corynebacterium pseudodiphtheriticum]
MGKKHTSNKVIVETILATGMSHKDAAALFNVSTRWIRELLHRYREGGYQALQPRSRAPHSNPRQVPESTVKTILEIRQHLENTGQDNGAHTIRWHLQQQKITPLPAASTIHRILKRHGYVIEQPHKRPRSSWKRFEADQPNETWQLDYSHCYLNNNQRVAILTIINDHSRFVIACKAFEHETGTNVIDTFISAGNKHGFPKSTLTDNGSVFTTKLYRKADTRNGFEQLLLQMGIQQKNGTPYHPQTQGKVERFHQTLQKALHARPFAHNIGELNQQLDDIIDYYNNHRPHRALNRQTPAQAYNRLPKAQPLDIPIGTDNRLRRDKVDNDGKVTLRWAGNMRKLYVGRKHRTKEIMLICINNDITAINPHTGEIWGRYHLDKTKKYHRNQLGEI